MNHQDPKKIEPAEVLDEFTAEAIDFGLAFEQLGACYTLEEAVKFARERRKEWTTIPKASA